jgi:glycosyltransferase involved in cell wall biosynthesis
VNNFIGNHFMKIGVDATCWGNKRGFGRFTRELLESILELDKTNEYLFFIDADTSESETIPSQVKKIEVQTEASQLKAASANGRRSVKDLWAMSREVYRNKVDIFFFPAVYSYFPILNRTKVIVTIHDVIADNNPELVFPNSKSKIFWKIKQNVAVRQSDLILTVSDYSKQEISKYFNLPATRLRVISEGARSVFKVLSKGAEMEKVLKRFGLDSNERFLLYVGGISPHKNLSTLIDAFKRISQVSEQSQIKLVLVGDYQDDPFFSAYPSLKKQVENLDLADKVIFTGFIPDEDLAQLYNAATLLVFPSFEEGFGLPAVEAMACALPVAASNCSSLPEVIGQAGRFFDPRDEQNMAEVILKILNDDSLINELKELSLKRSKEFAWKKAAKDTLTIFEELVLD